MPELKCEVVRDLLPLYHDGVCSEESKTLLEEHLTNCKDCREELIGMDAILPETANSEAETLRAVGNAWSKVKKRTYRKGLRVGLAILLCAALCVGLFFTFFFAWSMEGVSMEPRLCDGDFCLFRRFVTPKRGDIVAVSGRFETGGQFRDIIRIAGVPGDVIDFRDGTLYAGGPCELYGFRTDPVVSGDIEYPYTLGEDEYFLLGDNQAYSYDSRYTGYGVIRRENIRGVLFGSLPALSSLFSVPGMNSSVSAVPAG